MNYDEAIEAVKEMLEKGEKVEEVRKLVEKYEQEVKSR